MILHKDTSQFLLDVVNNIGKHYSNNSLIKTSPVMSRLVCTGIYFPIPAGIEQVSLAFTPTTSSDLSCTVLMLILTNYALLSVYSTISNVLQIGVI